MRNLAWVRYEAWMKAKSLGTLSQLYIMAICDILLDNDCNHWERLMHCSLLIADEGSCSEVCDNLYIEGCSVSSTRSTAMLSLKACVRWQQCKSLSVLVNVRSSLACPYVCGLAAYVYRLQPQPVLSRLGLGGMSKAPGQTLHPNPKPAA